MAAALDAIAEARRQGFGSVEFAHGAEALRLEDHDAADELRLTFTTDEWSLQWRLNHRPTASVESSFVAHIGADVEAVVSRWSAAPCRLAVSAAPDTSLAVVLEGAMGVSRARPCVRAFSLRLADEQSGRPARGASGGPRLILRVPPPLPVEHVPTLREERAVIVDGVVEHWRIRFRDPPEPDCLVWSGCHCETFGPLQRGQADLVRSRPGTPDEVFPLSSIYGDLDTPARGLSEAVLPAWPARAADLEGDDHETLAAKVQQRKLVTLMQLRDYDHDGRATEFILPIGGVGCVFHDHVAVGITRRNPRLHVLGTAANPDAALSLGEAGWKALARGGGTYVQLHCSNHGSEQQTEVTLRADAAGIRGTTTIYECPRAKNRVISRTDW